MRPLFALLLTLLFVSGKTQQKFSEFPGTGFGLILPDTSFHYHDRGFMSPKYRASLILVNMESEPDLSNFRYGKMVDMMLKEISVPGITILLDKNIVPDSGRIIKTRIAYDSTDAAPATKGRVGIGWFYLFKYKDAPLVIMGNYDLGQDAVLNDAYYNSLKSFGPVDSLNAKKYFRNKFSITDDYTPLKFCGESIGGIRLNMEGKYMITGSDSSYCLVVPVNVSFPNLKQQDARDYMVKRLGLKENRDVDVMGSGTSSGGPFKTYYITGKTRDHRLIYFCIKADKEGYFEIWGEAYNNNAALIKTFEKIADSLRRD